MQAAREYVDEHGEVQESPQDLEATLRRLRSVMGDSYYIEYAYGRPRLQETIDEDTGAARHVSPRLDPAELVDWMNAYLDGYGVGREGAAALEQAAGQAEASIHVLLTQLFKGGPVSLKEASGEHGEIEQAAAVALKVRRLLGTAEGLTVEQIIANCGGPADL